MGKVLDYLLKDDVKIIFDIDGVLAVFAFGDLCHNACPDSEWEKYVVKQKPYDTARPIPQMQRFLQAKGISNVYVCSEASLFEEQNKVDFVMRNYGIPEDHIFFVRDKKNKIVLLRQLARETGDETKVAIVEDTVETLNQVYAETDCITVHISSFFEWDWEKGR